MTIRPIIFSAPMVRALLEGRKTQTRRLATSPVRNYAPGDLLYVKENFSGPWGCRRLKPKDWPPCAAIHYWADGEPGEGEWTKQYPSIFMTLKASRLTLHVTDVRNQPLWSISDGDIKAEGVSNAYTDKLDPLVICWKRLWNGLHDKPGERWEDNPQVVALTFEVIRENVDRIEAAS